MGALGTTEHTVDIDGKTITFEAGLLAQQAGGAVVASLGDTKVLTTTTAGPTKEFLGFFPLTIEVEERMYAAGRIPGSFFAREGRPGENAILTCRLTDRPLRPTFAEGLRNEIQVVNTVLQTAQFDPYDVLAMNASSVSTMLSGVPFAGPIAAVRYGLNRNGDWIAFPSYEELEEDIVFQMVIAGRLEDDGDIAILMIEAEATDDAVVKIDMGAPKPTEELIGAAIESVKPILKALCDAQSEFVERVGVRETGDFKLFLDYSDEVFDRVFALAGDKVTAIYGDAAAGKEAKDEALQEVKAEVIEAFLAEQDDEADLDDLRKQAGQAFRSVEKKVVRRQVTETGVRIDGRSATDIRPLTVDVGVLDRTHGSGLFQRGDTQILSVLALGTTRDGQRIDSLDPIESKLYMHHYNMPPYSTGEAGRVGSPKRREIGHGLLAERALKPVLPDTESWPYAMRVVSEALSSNGSTSMASVCGSSLALMDGGVPIHAPVAGIAMGLIYENGTYTTLTDIQGVEDFYGDMDFKVAGTREFVTALQLDTKLAGIPADVLAAALLQAKDARLEILDAMSKVIAEPRDEVAPTAPRVEIVYIPQDKIGDVIGPRGKIIKELVEATGAQIDVDEEGGQGVVKIYANEKSVAEDAVSRINAIANPVLPEEGERFNATVVKTVDFGAFVSLTPGTDGLLHISELSKMVGRRLDHGEEAVNVGDTVLVEVLQVLDGGRKFKLEYVGEKAERQDSGDRGGRGGDRGGDRGDRGDRGGRSRDRSRGGDADKGSDRGDTGDTGDSGPRDDADAGSGGDEGRSRSRGRERSRSRSRSRERD